MAKLCECRNTFSNDRGFLGPVMNLLRLDWPVTPSVDNALVVLDRDVNTVIVKYRPVFLDEGQDCSLSVIVKMRYFQLRLQTLAMLSLIIGACKGGIDVVEIWGRVATLAQNCSTIDVVEEMIELVGLIRMATVIKEYVLALLLPFSFWGNPDGCVQIGGAWWHMINIYSR